MNLVRLFRFVQVLICVGVVVALACLVLPFKTSLSADHLTAAGTLSAAIASVFGLGIASIALWAYISKEEVGRSLADQAWEQKQDLEQALHQFGMYILVAGRIAAESGKPLDAEYERLLKPALKLLLEALTMARSSDLYRALDDGEGASLMLVFEAQIRYQLETNFDGVDLILITNYTKLCKALSKVTKDNIYQRVHSPLSSEIFDGMESLSRNIEESKAAK